MAKNKIKKVKKQATETDDLTPKPTLEGTILDTIKDSKERSVEIFITSLFVCLGIVFYALGYESLLTLGILLFGAIWNFFTSSNKFLSVIFAFLVCIPFAFVAINAGLYGHAFLHILLYLPTQMIFYYQERKNKDTEIQKNNTMSYRVLLFIMVSSLIFTFSLALLLYKIQAETLFWFDAISVTLLALSMFLINGRFRAYWLIRIIAVSVGCGLWITHGVLFNWMEGAIMFALLFGMYLIVDTYKYIMWCKVNHTKTDKLEKKYKKITKKEDVGSEVEPTKPLPL